MGWIIFICVLFFTVFVSIIKQFEIPEPQGALDYEGTTLFYYVSSDIDEACEYFTTTFYSQETINKKKYLFFGESRLIKSYKILFSLPFNIKSEHYSKEHVRQQLQNKMGLVKRKQEIENNQII